MCRRALSEMEKGLKVMLDRACRLGEDLRWWWKSCLKYLKLSDNVLKHLMRFWWFLEVFCKPDDQSWRCFSKLLVMWKIPEDLSSSWGVTHGPRVPLALAYFGLVPFLHGLSLSMITILKQEIKFTNCPVVRLAQARTLSIHPSAAARQCWMEIWLTSGY